MLSSRCHCCITQTLSLLSAAILLVVSHVALLLVLVIHLVTPHSQDSKEAFSSRCCQIRTHCAGSVHAPPRVSCRWKNISMLKHLNPGQEHQLMYFIVVSEHDREAELLTGIVVLFRSRKSESDLNIGLVFHSFIFLGVYSSPPQFKHFISSCHQKMFHPSNHPCIQHHHTFNSNFSQGFFITWNRRFWIFNQSFVYSRFFFPRLRPH